MLATKSPTTSTIVEIILRLLPKYQLAKCWLVSTIVEIILRLLPGVVALTYALISTIVEIILRLLPPAICSSAASIYNSRNYIEAIAVWFVLRSTHIYNSRNYIEAIASFASLCHSLQSTIVEIILRLLPMLIEGTNDWIYNSRNYIEAIAFRFRRG